MEKSMRVFLETEALWQRRPLDEDTGAQDTREPVLRAAEGESSRLLKAVKEMSPAECLTPCLANWERSVAAGSEPTMRRDRQGR